jgi:hypothetical protein
LEFPVAARTDLGLKHYLAAIEPPVYLSLYKWKVSNAGLKELAGLTDLETLDLRSTKVTNEGLKELAGLRNLKFLDLRNTKVTDNGREELQKALPGCTILHSKSKA